LHGNGARPQLAAIKDECESQSSLLRRGAELRLVWPIPKFARPRGTLKCELGNQRDISNRMTLVRSLDLKFLSELEAT
jgi:hypothetical protein